MAGGGLEVRLDERVPSAVLPRGTPGTVAVVNGREAK